MLALGAQIAAGEDAFEQAERRRGDGVCHGRS
jgi:hypothetical protein